MTRIGLATSGAVALAGCSGLSGDDSDDGGDGAAGNTTSASPTSTESGGSDVDTSSYESEVENTLQGAVELVSHEAALDDGSLVVRASVNVTDADAVDGDIYLRSDVSYSQITVGNDVDILSEYESGQSYDLVAQFPDVDPAKVKKYTVTLEAAPNEQPQN